MRGTAEEKAENQPTSPEATRRAIVQTSGEANPPAGKKCLQNPVGELEVPMKLINEQKQRKRTAVKMSPEVLESLVLLEKQWTKYRMELKLQDYQLIDRVLAARTAARVGGTVPEGGAG